MKLVHATASETAHRRLNGGSEGVYPAGPPPEGSGQHIMFPCSSCRRDVRGTNEAESR